jgi:rhodanese-related sulfurtransferase
MKTNYILAIASFIIGISAVFTNHADKNNLYPVWKYRTDRINKEKIRLISANYLSDLIYRKEQGISILDTRSSADYEEYHIPTSIPYNEQNLLSVLKSSDKVILYGDKNYNYLSEIPANLSGKIYNLSGGVDKWYSMVLFPDFSKIHVRNKQTLEKIINRSGYFGGTPQNINLLNISTRSSRFREGC